MTLEDVVSLEEGAEFYVEHLLENKEKSRTITYFYQRFDPDKKELLPHGKIGQLNRYYTRFGKLRRAGKLPKGAANFKDWIKQQVNPNLGKQLEQLTEKYIAKKYSLEQGVEFYIDHLQKNKEESKPIISFYERFDPEKQRILPYGKAGQLHGYYCRFNYFRNKGKLPENLTFEDWIKEQINPNLRKQLDKLTAKHLPKEYSLEQGVEFYIQHLKREKEESKPLTSFFIRFDLDKGVMQDYGKRGQLGKYYRKFNILKRKNKLSKKLSFEDYLIQKLPEEKRERASYYIKGQYLADLIDRRKLREVLLSK